MSDAEDVEEVEINDNNTSGFNEDYNNGGATTFRLGSTTLVIGEHVRTNERYPACPDLLSVFAVFYQQICVLLRYFFLFAITFSFSDRLFSYLFLDINVRALSLFLSHTHSKGHTFLW